MPLLYNYWPESLKRKVNEALANGLSLRVIAKMCNCSTTVIDKYKRCVYFPSLRTAEEVLAAERTKQLVDKVTEISTAEPVIAIRRRRVEAAQDRWERLQTLLKERGEDMSNVPGGKTGLLVRQYKQLGNGKDAQVVEEYKFDAAVLSEFREHEKQVAQDLGQWQESATNVTNIQVVVNQTRSETPAESVGIVLDVTPAR